MPSSSPPWSPVTSESAWWSRGRRCRRRRSARPTMGPLPAATRRGRRSPCRSATRPSTRGASPPSSASSSPAEDEEPPVSSPSAAPDVLVLDDHNLGFRDHPERWTAAVEGGPKAIVAKWHSPLGQGALWDRLQAQHADRLTVVVWVDDLRKDSLLVGYPLSWEQITRRSSRPCAALGLRRPRGWSYRWGCRAWSSSRGTAAARWSSTRARRRATGTNAIRAA